MTRKLHLAPALLTALLAVGTTNCAVNPATGERQLMLISEGREIAMGREADPQITAQMGVYDDPALAQFLSGIGTRMAALSERPDLPWEFKIVDDPIVNAFALPGGFIYISRGILAHFDSEAQLAAVVGHEIGHVTARHSAEQLSRAQLATVGLVAGALLAPEDLQGVVGAAGAGLGLLFLKFGRDDERQSDDLGLRYMTAAGYDPREMPGVFAMLGRVTAAAGGSGAPEWLSTHPNPENREGRINDAIAAMPPIPANARVERDGYLRRLDGMIFGADPRDGFFEEQQFYHPRMRFQMTFPDGWRTQNQRQAVVGVNADQNAIIQVTLSSASGPSSAAAEFAAQESIVASAPHGTSVNGLRATRVDFQATTDRGTFTGLAVFAAHNGNVFQLVGYGTAGEWGGNQGSVERALTSFASLDDARILNVQPQRVDIVTLDRPMTLAEFNRRYPSSIPLEQVALINQVEMNARLEAGRVMKRVVGG